MDVPIGICCNGSKPPFEGGSLGSNPSVPVKSDLFYMFRQMEKLIELLNEYENTLEPNEQIEWTENWVKSTPLVIISKKYWFIKWLVENEKIKWDERFYLEDEEGLFGTYECLLMQLAIQDEPINFLISILK